MELIVKNKLINGTLDLILDKLRSDCGKTYLFKDRKVNGNDLLTNCPYHKGGKESTPSCNILNTRKDPKLEFGKLHCFACGKSVTLPQLVSDCFNEELDFGEEWLVNNFGGDSYENNLLPEINLNSTKPKVYLSESILKSYDYYHPYMWQRKLTKEVVDKFEVGYDPLRGAITFPVRDLNNKLLFVTARSVYSKRFYIPKDADKPVYLLNYIVRENRDIAYVCESQLNALTLWTYGLPAVALFGTGSTSQYQILKRSGIRHYILCLDGDTAGDKGIYRLIKNLPEDVLIDIKLIPRDGRDVNDLSKEEFLKLPILDKQEWLLNFKKDRQIS